MARASDYVTEARAANKKVWDGINALVILQRESTALDYANTLPDGTGANAGINKAEVTAVVFTTCDALVAVLNAGHSTNMSKLL